MFKELNLRKPAPVLLLVLLVLILLGNIVFKLLARCFGCIAVAMRRRVQNVFVLLAAVRRDINLFIVFDVCSVY